MNVTDSENNITSVTSVIGKYKTTATAMLPTRTMFTPKHNYMSPTNNTRNAGNTNLKPQNRVVNSTLKSHYASKTSTFPPTRSANSQNKVTGTAKSPFTIKSTFPRANLARPIAYNHHGNTLKTLIRKTTTKTTTQNTVTNVTSTLSALTENCHLNGNNRIPSEPNLKSAQAQPKPVPNIIRKKLLVRSNSNSRKKLPKNNASTKSDTEAQELSSSDTTNLSIDLLDTERFRFRRKRDKSNSPEPMDCLSNSVITADVTPDNYEETANSQGKN